MSFKKFNEFLKEQKAHKWKLPEKTEEPKDGVHKGTYIKPTDYYAPGANKNPGLMTADDDRGIPLGEKGSPGMTPEKSQPFGKKPAGSPKKIKHSKGKMPKMNAESFLNKTAKLSDSRFVETMLNNVREQIPEKAKIRDLYGREFTPEPAETMKYVAALMVNNESIMARMLREVKRQGGLEALVNEIFVHPEAFDKIAEAATQEGAFAARLRRKLIEAVAEPRAGGEAGPNGASAGPLGNRRVGGGAPMGGGMMPGGGTPPPGPPSGMEGEETPEGEDTNMDLLDDDDGEEKGEEDEDGNHIHFHGGKHVHHHHHGDKDSHDDEFNDEDDEDDMDDDDEDDDDDEEDSKDILKPRNADATAGKASGGETGGGIGGLGMTNGQQPGM